MTERGDAMVVHSDPSVDGGLVGSRLETKYLVSSAWTVELHDRIGGRLSAHHHSVPPGIAGRAVNSHLTTTVYFDTPRRDMCRAATRGYAHTKVRARMYRDEPAPPSDLEPPVWMELKERDGLRSGKRRCPLELGEAARWASALSLRDETAVKLACDMLSAQSTDPAQRALLAELARMREVLGAPLEPTCVVRYRREAFQDAEAMLRITLDQDVRAYRAPSTPFALAALDDSALGAPAHEEAVCVVEVKSHGAPPAWIIDLLDTHGARALSYSKLAMASRAIHGPL